MLGMDPSTRFRFRRFHFVLCVCIGIGSLVFYTGLTRVRSDSARLDHGRNSSLYYAPGKLLGSSSCTIPDFDPWDSLVENVFLHTRIKHCPKAPAFFIRTVVKGSYTVPNLAEDVLWKHYRLKRQNLHCKYRATARDYDAKIRDASFRFEESKQLVFDQRVDSEYIWIECSRYGFRKKFYEQPLLLAHSKLQNLGLSDSLLNVLVIGLDSVSRLNFHRQLKRTRKFLLEERANTTVELLGYNKVGLNSGPNQIPLLTGKRFRPHGLYETVKKRYVDNMTTFIWQDYKEAGYLTLFLEEQWNYGLFVWPDLKGFFNVPTDYWPRPIMQAIDKSDLKSKFGSNICLGPKPAAAMYLDYLLDIFRVSQSPLWLYAWFSELSHDDFAGVGRADEIFFEFFLKLAEEGYLDKTVVIFLADHGFRFGTLRHFPLGRYEDQLPFAFVLLPENLARDPSIHRPTLDRNARKLVTVYDLYETMLGLVKRPVPSSDSKTAYNIFSEEIPADRTCERAQIDFEFCSCYQSLTDAPIKSTFKFKLGRMLVDQLNAELDRNNDTKCRRWKLKSVDEASELFENSLPKNAFRVSVTTDPPGNFEACIHEQRNGSLLLSSNPDRTDFYSKNAYCVIPSPYERYCYCKQNQGLTG